LEHYFWEIVMHARKLVLTLAAALALSASVSAALAHGKGHNPTRHSFMNMKQIPSEYQGVVNTLGMTKGNIAAGARLYEENCAACHGVKGDGRGEAAADLKPPPPALTGMYGRPMMGMGKRGRGSHMMHGMVHHHPGLSHAQAMGGLNLDAYNFWAVSEGGEKFGSSMPAFKEMLTDQERWQILLYIANGLTSEPG
jgi:mono/diheme cytochrome c family protein